MKRKKVEFKLLGMIKNEQFVTMGNVIKLFSPGAPLCLNSGSSVFYY